MKTWLRQNWLALFISTASGLAGGTLGFWAFWNVFSVPYCWSTYP